MSHTADPAVAPPEAAESKDGRRSRTRNPAVFLVLIAFLAMLLTYVLPAGKFAREKKLIVPGSYKPLEKHWSLQDILVGTGGKGVRPVSLVEFFHSIPAGIVDQADLIFMVMFIGGMFGVLTRTGAIDAGLGKLLAATRGNVYVLVPILMVVLSTGATFMGMAKEYLIVIPVIIGMTDRLGLSKLIGLAIVAIPVKVGYLASISNPLALAVAQPLVDVPTFSGMWMRVLTYAVMMAVGIAFVLWRIRRELRGRDLRELAGSGRVSMTGRQAGVLIALGLGVVMMVVGALVFEWDGIALAAYYMVLAVVIAVIGGFSPSATADAFIDGMKKVMIAAVLIGLATAVAIILKQGHVLDTIIEAFVSLVGGQNPYLSAYGMFAGQLLLDVAIPSTSGQAAVTMPIMGPVGQLAGVSGQTTVFAFLMGNGLTNIITPTSSGLLIFLAAAEVEWTKWARFILPLFGILAVVAIALLTLAVAVGY